MPYLRQIWRGSTCSRLFWVRPPFHLKVAEWGIVEWHINENRETTNEVNEDQWQKKLKDAFKPEAVWISTGLIPKNHYNCLNVDLVSVRVEFKRYNKRGNHQNFWTKIQPNKLKQTNFEDELRKEAWRGMWDLNPRGLSTTDLAGLPPTRLGQSRTSMFCCSKPDLDLLGCSIWTPKWSVSAISVWGNLIKVFWAFKPLLSLSCPLHTFRLLVIEVFALVILSHAFIMPNSIVVSHIISFFFKLWEKNSKKQIGARVWLESSGW